MNALRRLSALLLILSLAAGVAVLQPAGPAHASTTSIGCPANGGALATSISNATGGDTLQISCDGTNSNNIIAFTAPIEITKNITLDSSQSAKPITFDGGNASQLFTVDSGDTLILIGGDTPDIPAIPAVHKPAVRGTTLDLAHATHGLPPADASCGADNSADTAGGAIFVSSGATLDVTNTSFSNDSVCSYGGAIADFGGTLNVTGSTFQNDVTSAAGGGAIDIEDGEFSGATATITGSTFQDNSVIERGSSQGGSGGAIAVERGSSPTSATITNSTFNGNTAFSSAGAIFSFNGANVTVTNSTFAANSATFGGGTFATQLSSPITLANSIITAPQSDQQGCEGTSDITDEGYNVADGSSSNCLSGATGDLTGVNPSLNGLSWEGGPTLTMTPNVTAPEIDRVPKALCPATDQRGDARPDLKDGVAEANCDAGAVEFDFPVPTPQVASISPNTVNAGSGDTQVSLTDGATPPQTSLFPFSVVTFQPPSGSAMTLSSSYDGSTGKITATVPASALTGGNGSPAQITVANPPDGEPSTAQNLIIDPVISSLQATAGDHISSPVTLAGKMESSTTDVTLQVNGDGFCNIASCLSTVMMAINSGTPAALTTTYVSGTQLTATIPHADLTAGDTVHFSVANADGGSSSLIDESVLAPKPGAPPVLTSISPNATFAGAGPLTLTLNGSAFSTNSIVQVMPSACAANGLTPTSFSSTQLRATIPAACLINAGSLMVEVLTAPAVPGYTDGGGASGTQTLTINPVPTLPAVTPNALETGNSAVQLVITGTNFQQGASAVWTVNGNDTGLFTTWNSAAQVTAMVPAALLASPVTADLRVVNPDGGTSPQTEVQILAPNLAASLDQNVAVAFEEGDPDQPLTLGGTNFVAGADVRWTENGVTQSLCSANPCNVVSSTSIALTVPSSLLATAGTATLTVVNPPALPGYSDGGSANRLTVTITNPVPTLTSLNPNGIATASASTVITINGTGFVSSSTVKWNNSTLTSTYVSPTQLTATVPSAYLASTNAGLITVTNPGPGGGTSNPLVLEVTKTGAKTSESLVAAGAAGVDGATGTPGSLNASTDGGGLLAVARYSSAPGTPTFNTPENGTYFDVYLQPGVAPAPTMATIVDCTLNGGNTAYYQDPATYAWKAVSNQAQTPSGCITMTIAGTGSPSLSQMHATAFGIGKDTTPPVTSASATGVTGSTGAYLRPIKVNLTATDNSGGSGVRSLFYALPPAGASCSSATYTSVAGSSAAVSITQPQGMVLTHTLCYYAQDAAGNAEPPHTATYTIDTTERVLQTAHASFLNASGAHTVSVNAMPGDLLVAVLTCSCDSAATAPTMTAGGHSFSLDAPSGLGKNVQALTFHLTPTAAVTSVSVTTPLYAAYDVWIFDVANPFASALDASGGAFKPASTSMSITTSGPTSIANDFVVAAAVSAGSTAPGVPAGYTSPATLVGTVTKSRVAYSLTNALGTQTANFGTLAASANLGLAIAAYGGT